MRLSLCACWLVSLFLCNTLTADAQRTQERKTERVTRPEGEPDLERAAKLIVEQTNKFRKSKDLSALETNKELTKAADYFAKFMARTGKYGHTADGKEPAERAAEHGYKYCVVAENIAWQFNSLGFETKELASEFVKGWKNSPEHRKNMLDPDVTETGVAVARSDESGRYYAVQMFGLPKSKETEFQVVNESNVTVRYELGDREFPLPPRYSRTHVNCRPSKLTFLKGDEGSEKQESFDPKDGDTFLIRKEAEGYAVTRKDAEK